MKQIDKIMSSNIKIAFSLVLSMAYIFTCAIYSNNIQYIGDTLVYSDIYNSVDENYFIYGIEFIVPTVMYILHSCGLYFHDFIFISLCLWTPIVFLATLMGLEKKYYYLLSLAIFLLTPYFFLNAIFLIRQYYAALFFICALFIKNKKIYFILLCAAIFSHISAIIWVVLSLPLTYRIVKSKLILFLLLFITICSYVNISIFSLLMDFIIEFSYYFDIDVLKKKTLFYRDRDISVYGGLPFYFLWFSIFCFLSSLYLITRKNIAPVNMRLYTIILLQSTSLILFKDNIIFANRIGFFVYYFSIPCAFFLSAHIIRYKII
ncbi:EpsG family protein [Morganella morganii]|uniref:EpsG family protein n=1 Tax=Morganella morganii TaxID=582 RepID=UPI0016446587|nr:EpsG family protein [Morganella morganii]